jgi:hypothetical protein
VFLKIKNQGLFLFVLMFSFCWWVGRESQYSFKSNCCTGPKDIMNPSGPNLGPSSGTQPSIALECFLLEVMYTNIYMLLCDVQYFIQMYIVLDRVKMFLPQMAQANIELEKQIAGVGKESVVIDGTILADSSDEEEVLASYTYTDCIGAIYVGHYTVSCLSYCTQPACSDQWCFLFRMAMMRKTQRILKVRKAL